MIVRRGFDLAAALAMRQACGMDDDETFVDRARECDFWSLYTDRAVGGVLVEMDHGRPSIHVGSLVKGRSGRAVARAVAEALDMHKRLFAAINRPAPAVERLAQGLGFLPLVRRGTWIVYGREA